MIAIIDGCGTNIASLLFAFQRIGKDAVLTQDPDIIQQASHVILPGVGAAKPAMQKLAAANLITVIQQLSQPVLGICLGMQLLFEKSEEADTDCLGIIPGNIEHFPEESNLIIPHMGWNQLRFPRDANPLFNDIEDNSYVYFVHSYRLGLNDYTISSTNYGDDFSSAIQYKNFYATQFHPERSGKVGEKILENFLKIEQ